MKRANKNQIYSEDQLKDIKIIVGNRMRTARELKGYTQIALADLLNKNTIYKLENGTGNPSLGTLLKLSSLLDVSLENLFADIERYIKSGIMPNEQTTLNLDNDNQSDGC